jgi:Co/Zn/Cd efflux system component
MSHSVNQNEPLLLSEVGGKKKITNQTVLLVTAVLFAGFVIAEIIGALAGNSLSLLGDGAAMSVDVLTVIVFFDLN